MKLLFLLLPNPNVCVLEDDDDIDDDTESFIAFGIVMEDGGDDNSITLGGMDAMDDSSIIFGMKADEDFDEFNEFTPFGVLDDDADDILCGMPYDNGGSIIPLGMEEVVLFCFCWGC